ncbi:DinB family protein [Nocardioides sp. LS1]|uniref:DinB family protein n=1 Tax=Nocardioides sp. LS1 TaxID=1027620 RepID=UPI000F61AAE4|nr:DinB family protein [Nocardioides sp. LS1]GCD88722.1 methyltransferase type 12 [Nocardioides sp. LS1]
MEPVTPDTKDWTWVLDRPCPECGFVAADVPARDLAGRLLANAASWARVLDGGPGLTKRPAPQVWSPTEYACHVRDVHRVFDERVRLMLEEDVPHFANWDQDETAVQQRYDLQDPVVVGRELTVAANAVAERYAAVPDDAWGRAGIRSNGSGFTVESLGRYHLHDVVHHLHDVSGAMRKDT